MSDDTPAATAETAIDRSVIDRVADETGVAADELTNALVELHATLLGRHSTFERRGDYVTVDGVRAYRVGEDDWASVREDVAFEESVASAVRRAHTEQARLLFSSATDADEGFADDEVGVVVGVDTAEEF